MPRTSAETARPGMSKLVAAFAGGTKHTAEQDELKNLVTMDEMRARIAAHNAKASEDTAQAESLASRQRFLAPDNVANALSALSATPLPQANRYADYMKSGNFGTRAAVQDPQELEQQADQGTPAPAPITINEAPADLAPHMPRLAAAMRNLTVLQGAKDWNPDNVAKATGEYQGQDITAAVQDAIRRGAVQDASAMNQGGKLGQQIKLFDNIGNTGATFAPATGAVQSDPAAQPGNKLLAWTQGEMEAQAAQRRAQAREADAKAAQATGEGPLGKPPQGWMWGPKNAQGQPTLVKIPGGPADLGRALSHAAVKDLSAAGQAVEDTQRLQGSFQDAFGGKTVLGDMSNTYKRIFGDKTGQAQWWQDMDTLQNQTRHALFGSALTKTELAAWDKTSITPRMEPDQIKKNLERRSEIEARAASKLARAYEAAGYNKDQIVELLGIGARYLEAAAPPVRGSQADVRRLDAPGEQAKPRAGWKIEKVSGG